MNLPRKNWLEWLVFGLSALLVIGALGYLSYDAVTMGDAPAMLQLQVGDVVAQPDGFAVPVTVTNQGDQTAEDVQIEVVLMSGGTEIERGEFSVAFVPRGSQGQGWIVLRKNPVGGELTAKVLGYGQP